MCPKISFVLDIFPKQDTEMERDKKTKVHLNGPHSRRNSTGKGLKTSFASKEWPLFLPRNVGDPGLSYLVYSFKSDIT